MKSISELAIGPQNNKMLEVLKTFFIKCGHFFCQISEEL